ncbi:MAG TPA: autotransporter-associated beta strand repeat-containing protein, partial [Gammaproteobacteria bacterium]|nr:autotransporter-associated beta strand repeat-containing protein [Gammaproteobacteria bacterium]
MKNNNGINHNEERDTQPGRHVRGTIKHSVVLALSVVLSLFFTTETYANPQGGQVTAGSAAISSPNANTVQINQSTPKAVIDWRSYNIAEHEKTQYVQPSSQSITLNRIDPHMGASIIRGAITANGKIILINPAGMLFTSTAVIDVSGLLATTANITNDDFMAGRYHFVQSPEWNGAIINEGKITIRNEGIAALVAPGVENNGVIVAKMGKVILASGTEYTIDFYGDEMIQFGVNSEVKKPAVAPDGRTLHSAVSNNGTIIANGGKVLLAAKTAGHILDNSINMSGRIEANTIAQRGGSIVLMGGGNGTVKVSGKMIASGKHRGQRGGTVKVLGDQIQLADNASIDVSGHSGGGTILVGGNYQGKGPEQNATHTLVAQGVNLNASALHTGNGGKVIVWADDTTDYAGNIIARGGMNGGDGGLAEVSGHQLLSFHGKVDLRAPRGMTGTLLLDPRDLTIQSSGSTTATFTSSPSTYTSDVDSSILTVNDLQTALGTASVIVQTGASGTQAGNITVANAIAWANTNTLTLSASNNIAINAGISDSAAGTLVLNAPGAITQSASGIISGSLAVTKQGTGTATFNQTNTYTGITTVSGGTLSISTLANQGSNSNVGTNAVLINGGTLSYTGNTASVSRQIAVGSSGGTLQATTSGQTLTLSGTINPAGAGGGANPLTIDVNAGNITLNPASVTTALSDLTVSGSGTGTLLLSKTGIYTGSTTINSGKLKGGIAGALPSSTDLIFNGSSSATYDLNNFAQTVDVLSGTNTNAIVTNSGGGGGQVLTLANSTNGYAQSYAGTLTGNLGFTLNLTGTGSPTQTFTNAGSSYTNANILTAGTLSVSKLANASSNSSIGTGATTPAISIAAAGILQYTGTGDSTTRAITLTGSGATLDASGSGGVTFGGNVTGNTFGLNLTGTGSGTISSVIGTTTGTLTKAGTGTWTLSGVANTYSGATTINNGILSVVKLANAGTNSSIGTGNTTPAISIGATGTLQYTGAGDTTARAITLTGSGGTLDASGSGGVTFGGAVSGNTFNLNLTGTGSGTLNGIIGTTTGALSKSGTGTWTLGGVNTYTGATTVTSGTLASSVTGGLGPLAGGNILLTPAASTTATLDLTTIGSLVNTNGNIQLDSSASSSTAQINFSTAFNLAKAIALTGTNNIFSVAANTTTLAGAITGGGGLTKSGAGTLALGGTSNANTYSGATNITAGTLQQATNANNFSANSQVNLSNVSGAILNLNSLAGSIGSLTGGGGTGGNVALTSAVLTIGNDNTSPAAYAGVISSTTSAGGITKTGSGTLTLSGSNTYTGPTLVNNGTLSIASTGGLGGTGSGGSAATVSSGAVLDLNFNSGTLADTNTITLNGTGISSGGALTFSGNSITVNNPITLGGTSSTISIKGNGGGTQTIGGGTGITGGSGDNLIIQLANAGVSLPAISLSNSLSVTAGGLITLNAGTLLTGGSSSMTLSGVGITNLGAATAPGGMTINAGTGTLTNTAGTLSNGGGAATTAINLTAGSMVLGGTITAGAAAVNLTSSSPGQPITIGTGSTGLGLSNAELDSISTTGTLTIGDATHTGTLSTDGVVSSITNPSGAWVFQTSGGAITLNNAVTTPNNLTLSSVGGGVGTGAITGSGALTIGTGGVNNLTVNAGAGINLSNTSNLANIVTLTNSTSGNISFDDNRQMTLTASNSAAGGTLSIINTGKILTGGAITTTGPGAANITFQSPSSLTISNAITAGGSGVVSLTGSGITSTSTVTGPGGVTANAGTGTLDNSAGVFTNSSGSTAINLTADTMTLAGGTITGGSGAVNLTTATANRTITIAGPGGGLVLMNTALNTITTTGILTIGDTAHTGTFSTNGTVSGVTNPSGAWIFQTRGAAITLNSAVTTPNDLTLSSVGGGVGTGSITGTGALTIGSGGANSLTVNAGAGINLSNASNLANAVTLTNSTSGNISFNNNRNMTLTASNSVSGSGGTLSVINNTGTLATSGAITTAGSGAPNITLQTPGLLTINNAITANGSGLVSLTGGGITNLNTVTGPGGITANAGTGTLNNASGILTNSSGSTAINLTADTMTLASGTITGGSGAVNITSSTLNRAITIGSGASGLGLSNTALNTITTSGILTIGDAAHTGTFSTDGAVSGVTNPSGAWIFRTNGGAITLNNAVTTPNNLTLNSGTAAINGSGALTIGTAGANSLTVNAGAGINLSSTSNLANAVTLTNSTSGNISFNNNRNMTLTASNSVAGGTLSVINNTGTLATSGAISTTGSGAANITLQTPGLLTINNAITAGGSGSVSLTGGGITNANTVTGPGGITANAGTGTLDNSAGSFTNSSGSTAINLTADTMTLASGTITGGSGAVNLTSSTLNRAITIGSGASGLGLSNTALNTITTSGILTIGNAAHTGTFSTDGAVSGITNPSGAWVFQTSGGAITLNNAVTTPNNLTLSSVGGGVGTGAINGTGALTIGSAGANNLTVNAGAGINLSNSSNLANAVTLTNSTSGNISFNNNRNMTLAANNSVAGGTLSVINNTGTLATSGNITVGSGASSITLQTPGQLTINNTVTSGNGIVLAGGSFVNNVGASALNPGTGSYLVWSGNPANDTRGGLAYNFKQYNATYNSSTVLGTGNGFLYTIAPTVTPVLTGTVSKSYNANTVATLAAGNYTNSGAIDNDTITFNNPTSGTYATANVGTNINVAVSGISLVGATDGSATVYGYQLAASTANANIGTITAAPITVSSNAGQTKIYGNDDPASAASAYSLTSGTLFGGNTLTGSIGRVAGETVGSYNFTQNTVTVSDGNSGNNYAVTFNGSSNPFQITAKALSASIANQTKVYGANDPTLSGISVNLTGIVNRSVTDINGNVTAINNTGQVAATIASLTRTAGETVASSPYNITAVTFNALSGSAAGNYSLANSLSSTPTLSVTAAPLSASIANQTKVYGANDPLLSGIGVTLGGVINRTVSTWNGNVSVNDTGNVATSLASLTRAAGETVASSPYNITAVTFNALSGSAAGNYTLANALSNAPTLSVTAAPLSASIANQTKVYGANDPLLSGIGVTLGGVINRTVSTWNGNVSVNDTGNVATSLASLTRDAGEAVSGSPYNITAVTFNALSGSAAGNYSLANSFSSTPTLSVTAASLSASIANQTKVYGANDPLLSGIGVTLSGIINRTVSTWNGNVSVNDTGNVTASINSLVRDAGE